MMNRCSILVVTFSLLALGATISGAPANEEEQLIQILKSDRSLLEKDEACSRLKWIGTPDAITALADLLTDEQLSHSARLALESMFSPEAGRALTEMLAKTTGLTKIGIINSLGVRRETQAVPILGKLLDDLDMAVAVASATALGRVGDVKALALLEGVGEKPSGPLQAAIVDGCLRCANNLLGSGDKSKALSVFKRLYAREKSDYIQIAAYRGVILSSESGGLALMTGAISGPAGPSRTAAIQLVHEIDLPGVAKAVAELLPRVTPQIQVALIGSLAQRNDPTVMNAIVGMAGSDDSEVRVAALTALGTLGDASVVPLLAEHASSAANAERAAARESLVDLSRGEVSEMLLKQLADAKPAVQAELARALGDRGETAAVPKLLALAQQGSDSARQSALQALTRLSDQPHLGALVNLVTEARNEAARSDAAEALNAIVQRVKLRRGHVDAGALLRAATSSSPDARIALLPICSGLIDSEVRATLRGAVQDTDPKIRTAAIRALCDSADGEVLPDLLRVATASHQDNLRALAIAACVRLATQEETVKLSNSQKVEALKPILAANPSADEKRLVLAGLGEIPDLESLKLAEALIDEVPVQTEAARATIKIASTLPETSLATGALKKVIGACSDAAARQEAESALKNIEARAGFIIAWQIAGPYRQAGKDYVALFDFPFPPETADAESASNLTAITWKNVIVDSDSKRPGVIDLLKALGGEQCAAYARTWVHSEQEQPARLELGSDDGIKVWLNQKQVHAHNLARALQPGSDKADIMLKAGWNLLLLKVTQNNQGWAFCARLVKPDNSTLHGVRFDASRNAIISSQPESSHPATTAKPGAGAGDLVPLSLKLPSPAFKGTPKNIQIGSYVEPLSDKPRPPLMVPSGLKNLAPGAKLSRSDKNATAEMLAKLTDGDKESSEESIIFLRKGTQWVQMDFGAAQEIFAIVVWHAHNTAKVYHDVIVQVSDDPDFTDKVRTIFNNDQDNSSGLGVGTDREYFETHEGKLIDAKGIQARYIRFYSKGSTESPLNEYTEIEVYGRPSR